MQNILKNERTLFLTSEDSERDPLSSENLRQPQETVGKQSKQKNKRGRSFVPSDVKKSPTIKQTNLLYPSYNAQQGKSEQTTLILQKHLGIIENLYCNKFI